jgi:hypothetical protein
MGYMLRCTNQQRWRYVGHSLCLLVFEGSSNKSPFIGMDSAHEVVLEPIRGGSLKSLGGLPCEMASSNPVNQPRHALPEYASLSLPPWDTSVT